MGGKKVLLKQKLGIDYCILNDSVRVCAIIELDGDRTPIVWAGKFIWVLWVIFRVTVIFDLFIKGKECKLEILEQEKIPYRDFSPF